MAKGKSCHLSYKITCNKLESTDGWTIGKKKNWMSQR